MSHTLPQSVCVCVCMELQLIGSDSSFHCISFHWLLYFQELLFGNGTFWLPVMMSTSYRITRVKKKQADPQNPLCFLFTAAAGTVYSSATGVSWSAPASVSVSVSLHKNSRSHMWSGTSGSICMPVVVGNTLCRKMISHVLAASGPLAGNI